MIDFNAVKAAVSMEELLAEEGVEVKRGWAICPFHPDSKPSMRIYPDGFYCFACGAGGDVINYVARRRGISNSEAAALLAKGAGVLPLTYREIRERARAKREREHRKALCAALIDDLTAQRRQAAANGENTAELDEQLDELVRGFDRRC